MSNCGAWRGVWCVLSVWLLSLASCSNNGGGLPATSPGTRPAQSDLTIVDAPAEEVGSSSRTPAPHEEGVWKIREEGLTRSQVMKTLSYLTDVIGPRLTNSPNTKRANEWTRDTLVSWGCTNGHLESWGPFGRGWSLQRFSAQVVEPQAIPLIAWPKAWTPGLDSPVTGEVVHVQIRTEADFDKYRGKLGGAIVLLGEAREVQARFDPLASRASDAELQRLATAQAGSNATLPGRTRATTASERLAQLANARGGRGIGQRREGAPARAPATAPSTQPDAQAIGRAATRPTAFDSRVVAFVQEQGAAVLATPSPLGDGGTLLVASATVPNAAARDEGQGRGPATRSRVWDKDAPKIIPQMSVAIEDYNRLVRMLRQGEKLRMQVDLQARFHDDDLMGYNTIAEIPGTDLKDEIVMLGAHLDSWHSGTGATDNGAGVAATMEAMRIIAATKLRPRRTIRIGLWTGEEQGLLGSKAYVARHFGEMSDAGPSTRPTTRPAGSSSTAPSTRPARLVKRDGYEKLSVYLNMDHGTGKVRGLYFQGNSAARDVFRAWAAPLSDLGVQTLSPASTGGTDHVPFHDIGLPGFTMIQDPLEYWSRTHHTNADVYDRAQADDMKQAATVLAALAYQAAMADEKVPRKALGPR